MMRPASLTHHSCSDQRYVELEITEYGDNYVKYKMPLARPGTPGLPADSNLVPAGYYMIFLVSNAGVPSVARWVKLQ